MNEDRDKIVMGIVILNFFEWIMLNIGELMLIIMGEELMLIIMGEELILGMDLLLFVDCFFFIVDVEEKESVWDCVRWILNNFFDIERNWLY